MSKLTLERCPFCHSDNIDIASIDDIMPNYIFYFVCCKDCLARGPISQHNKSNAIEFWNLCRHTKKLLEEGEKL